MADERRPWPTMAGRCHGHGGPLPTMASWAGTQKMCSNIASRQAICNHLFVLAVVTAFQMPSPRRKRTSSAPVILRPRYTDTSEGRRFAASLPPTFNSPTFQNKIETFIFAAFWNVACV